MPRRSLELSPSSCCKIVDIKLGSKMAMGLKWRLENELGIGYDVSGFFLLSGPDSGYAWRRRFTP